MQRLVELGQDGEGRQAGVVGALRGVEQQGPHLARRDAEAPLEIHRRLALLVNGLDPGAKDLLRVGIEPLQRRAAREQVHLLGGGERRDDRRERVGVALGLGLAHAREHGELRGDPGRVGRDVAAHVGRDLRVVDHLLVVEVAQVRRAQELKRPRKLGNSGCSRKALRCTSLALPIITTLVCTVCCWSATSPVSSVSWR